MKQQFATLSAVVLAAALAFSTPAVFAGQTAIDVGMHSTAGNYNYGTSVYDLASNAYTFGGVQRLYGVAQPLTAYYNAGFTELSGLADFALTMDISNVTGGDINDTADGNGTFSLTDLNGDTITGSFVGTWTYLGIGAIFEGAVANVYVNDINSDGLFEGPSGGSFPLDFSPLEFPFRGTIVNLSFDGPGWFFEDDGTFEDMQTDTLIKIIPAPGAALLGFLGLSAVAWLRRRV